MQKKLIALAIAGLASSAAFAQTNVTLGGNVEVGYAGYENKVSGDGLPYDYKKTDYGFRGTDNQGWTSSQLTINVVEDLGNGLRAGYDHAIGLGIFAGGNGVDQSYASGNNAAFQRTRMSRAYLANNNWGRVAVGYQYTLEDQIQGIGRAGSGNLSNVGEAYNAQATVLTPVDGKTYSTSSLTAGEITRANMIEYASPVWSGLQVLAQAGYTDSEEDSDMQYSDTEGQLYGIGVKYANGPLALGAVYQFSKPNSSSKTHYTYTKATDVYTAVNKSSDAEYETSTYLLSGSYDFKVVKLFGRLFYRDLSNTVRTDGAEVVGSGDGEYKGGDIGIHVPFANRFKFIATAGMATQKLDPKFDSKAEFDIWAYQVALTYDLSKRTSATAYFAQNEFKGDKAADGFKSERTIGGIGLKHSF